MHRRMALGSVLGALAIIAGFFATAGPVAAAPTAANPHMTSKLILADTSIDSPALWESHGTPFTVLAWTGTDPAHHVNVMTSPTNMTSQRDKRVLGETSFAGPAVTVTFANERWVVAVAWTGTDARHTLNVLYDVYGSSPKKLTLWGYSSFTGPSLALAADGKALLLAWAGTDTNHSINVLPINIGGAPGLTAGARTALLSFHSTTRPNLSAERPEGGYLLTWSVLESHRIAFATTADGKTFTIPTTSPLAEWTTSAPSLTHIYSGNYPPYFLAWAGTDPNHSLNLQYTSTFPGWGNTATTKTTFREWCLGGPALDWTFYGLHPWVAWTGTDPAHHLNLARFDV